MTSEGPRVVVAKHGRKGRFRRYLRGQIDFQLALGTLGTKAVIGATVGDTVSEKAWCSSVNGSYSLADFTAVVDRGPILVGVAHGDYSDAEIEEWLESIDSWEEADLIGQEIAKRKIRRIGTFRIPVGSVPGDHQVLNDGKNITTKCGWVFTTGQTLRFWAYNMGDGGLTTGSEFNVQGHANLWPM